MTAASGAIIRRLERGLTPLGPFRSRAMFGGHGLYLEDLFFGLIAYDRLYLKTDESTRGDYVRAGSRPFSFESGRKGLVTTSYWRCPDEVMKDAGKLRRWVAGALEAARRARAAKPERKSRRTR